MATEKPQIVVRVDRVYGKPTIYPVNAAAQTITTLTGTKTLSVKDLECAKALGFEVSLAEGSANVLNEALNAGLAQARA